MDWRANVEILNRQLALRFTSPFTFRPCRFEHWIWHTQEVCPHLTNVAEVAPFHVLLSKLAPGLGETTKCTGYKGALLQFYLSALSHWKWGGGRGRSTSERARSRKYVDMVHEYQSDAEMRSRDFVSVANKTPPNVYSRF